MVEVGVAVVAPPEEEEVDVEEDDEFSPDNIITCITRTLHLFFHSVLLSVTMVCTYLIQQH